MNFELWSEYRVSDNTEIQDAMRMYLMGYIPLIENRKEEIERAVQAAFLILTAERNRLHGDKLAREKAARRIQ